MLEYQQVLACLLTVRRWFESMRKSDTPLILRRLWIDDSSGQPRQAQSGGKQAEYTYILDAPWIETTGNIYALSFYPPEPWRGVNPRPLHSLSLQDVGSTPRTLMLHLKECYVQVEMASHVICQRYTTDRWAKDIVRVPFQKRRFLVGLAFDFGEAGVLAFLTPTDKRNIKAHWSKTIDALPCQCADVYTNYVGFLEGVAAWIRHRHQPAAANKQKLAIVSIQEAEFVFGGMGPYTVNEVFYLAGLSPFLTEGEVFGCPSRTARLCEAFWSFAHHAHSTLPSLLKPCYDDFVLSASTGQRLQFCRQLHIYGQQQVGTSLRMNELAQRYKTRVQGITEEKTFMRNAIGGLFDVFEPTYLQPALQKQEPAPNLSHLVFGPIEWRIHGGIIPEPLDPLTASFKELGQPPDGPTNLELSRYRAQRFLYEDEMTKAQIPCELYEGPESPVQLWTISPQIPLDARVMHTTGRRWHDLQRVDNIEKRVGEYIIERTSEVFVGPLEHRGIGPIVETATKVKLPAPSEPGPSTPAKYVERNLKMEMSMRKTSGGKRKAPRLSLDFHVVRSPESESLVESPTKRRKVSSSNFPAVEGATRLGLLGEDTRPDVVMPSRDPEGASSVLVGNTG